MQHTALLDRAEPRVFRPAPTHPRLRLPRGACDAHARVLGPRTRFPFAERPGTAPLEAPKERLFALHAALGIERCVVVQSAWHGFDNWVTLDAMAPKNGAYRGIAMVPANVDAVELRRLDTLGFCGVRFSYTKQRAAPSAGSLLALAARLADLGWCLELHMEGAQIGELGPRLKRAPVPVVIEHMGRIDASLGIDQPAFRALLALMRNPRFWIKLSGAERISHRHAPWADVIPFARALVSEFGDRTVWGTDWPHPNAGMSTDDGQLAELLAEIAPTEAERHALLVANPRRLYRFPEPPAARR